MTKTIVCRCEDVTLTEIADAIDKGYRDIESLKRKLAVGTGPCQAKGCLVPLTKILIEKGALKPEDAVPIVSRPPLSMTPLKYFTGQKQSGD
jgi:bacterioferritin-associated ferredoxin